MFVITEFVLTELDCTSAIIHLKQIIIQKNFVFKKIDRFVINIFPVNFIITVKLGYNELGYNEHPVITNIIKTIVWFDLI